jgi:hypothetical protein
MKKVKVLLATLVMALPAFSFATGAIAVDDQKGDEEPGYGIAVGKDGKDEAMRSALAECRKAGNKNCKSMVWFEGCGAYASSTNFYGVGFGKTLKAAEKMALDKCGKSACEVKVSECDE